MERGGERMGVSSPRLCNNGKRAQEVVDVEKAIQVDSQEAATLDRFTDAFTRRRTAKERGPPVPAAPPAAAPVASSGAARGRPGDPVGEGCSPDEEINLKPCAVAVDHEAVQTWVYPTNVQVREYQKNFVQKALLTNTLVALPTGLGKTFIAAVVMYNYFRWFPEGKIVFTAPTRPLVTQQIEACHNTVGIPQEWTIDLKGNLSPSKRSCFWKSKRVFFVTPQVLQNDIQSGICMVNQLVCLVIDEAHRASGNYAYCVVVRELEAARVPLRILALTATPGSKQPAIQNVINNLHISELVHRDESDPDVSRYIQRRTVEILKIPVGSEAIQVNDKLLDIIRPHLVKLRSAGVIDTRDASNWSPHQLRMLKEKFDQAPPPHIPLAEKKEIGTSFVALTLLYGIIKMLLSYGIKAAHQSIEAKYKEGSWKVLTRNNSFLGVKKTMEDILSQGVLSPKVQKMVEVLFDHFHKNSKDSRVIVFAHYRECVKEIMCSLRNIDGELVRPAAFIGQSSTGDQLKGQTQKMQQAILQKFRSGEHNVIVATSIGEEGLDIMEVDLVVCFDANISALRMIQRMGRTGRKHEGRVDILFWEMNGYLSKQGNTKTMKKLLRDCARFEYHNSPRMVPDICKPELKFVKLSIEKYIPCSNKSKVDVNGTFPIFTKMSEEDGQLIAQYFGACKQDCWKPSLVTFPTFQVSPCDIYKVPHSPRTTNMLIYAMQQLQDLSCSRTKCASPLQGPTDVPVAMDEEPEGLHGTNASKEATPQEYCALEASSGKATRSKNVSLPSSPVEKYPVHSFFSGDYVTLDVSGYVSITFVPSPPRTSEARKGIRNMNRHQKVQNKSTSVKLAPDISRPTVEFDSPAVVAYSSKPIFTDEFGFAPYSPEYTEKCGHTDDRHVLGTPPSKTLTSLKEICQTPCNTKLVNPSVSVQDDMELSPRLTYYFEEGIVPESPMPEVNHKQLDADSAANVGFVQNDDFLKSCVEGAQINKLKSRNEALNLEEKGHFFAEISKFSVSPGENALDQTQANKGRTHPSNVKTHSPAAHTPTANLLCDSFSDDWQLRSGGDTSRTVQEAPKYRRLCKYGDKIKRVSSMSLDDRYDRTTGENCDFATKRNKRRAKRRLNTFIDDEAEVSEDADVSADEDNDHSEDKYEDSFIDDQATPTGQFTQSIHRGENNGDNMMAFYRRSLLTQSPVVLPSRYQDVLDSSASRGGSGSASCSSENLHNSFETPQGIQPHHSIGPSPLGDQQNSLKSTSTTKLQGETSLAHCESSTTFDCRKRKLSFQQAASIPIINLEPEPQPSSNLTTTGINNNFVWDDDDFFESLDLDAIEAQATELWKLKNPESTHKPLGAKSKASGFSIPPPSYDLAVLIASCW
uniref:Fanconi anemia group M protein n=1 Tax=Oryza brachyantha TaxID=4533 RepID=J3N6H0_ORYBR